MERMRNNKKKWHMCNKKKMSIVIVHRNEIVWDRGIEPLHRAEKGLWWMCAKMRLYGAAPSYGAYAQWKKRAHAQWKNIYNGCAQEWSRMRSWCRTIAWSRERYMVVMRRSEVVCDRSVVWSIVTMLIWWPVRGLTLVSNLGCYCRISTYCVHISRFTFLGD